MLKLWSYCSRRCDGGRQHRKWLRIHQRSTVIRSEVVCHKQIRSGYKMKRLFSHPWSYNPYNQSIPMDNLIIQL